MDIKSIRALMNLGLTQKESRVYLAALELGDGTVQDIAKKSGLKRTTIYPILEKLQKSGLAYQTKSKNRTHFTAEDPEELLKTFKNKISNFETNLAALLAFRNRSAKKPKIYFFDGAEGFKKIWQFILRPETKEYLIMTDPREMLSFVKKGYITGKIIKEKVRLGVKSRQIVASSEYAKEIVSKDRFENRVSKILPHIYKIPFTTIIFGGRVALISPHLENMILLIESDDFAKTQQSVFEALWNLLPERKQKAGVSEDYPAYR